MEALLGVYGEKARITELVDIYLDDYQKKKDFRILRKAFPLVPHRELMGNWIQVSEMHFEEWLPVESTKHAQTRVAELFETDSIAYYQILAKT